jgi:hypothetical protein
MEPNAVSGIVVPESSSMRAPNHKVMMTREPDKSKNLDLQIDENLRRIYEEKVKESVPDRFEDLLRRLREQDVKK